jgi:hypothetical protein
LGNQKDFMSEKAFLEVVKECWKKEVEVGSFKYIGLQRWIYLSRKQVDYLIIRYMKQRELRQSDNGSRILISDPKL